MRYAVIVLLAALAIGCGGKKAEKQDELVPPAGDSLMIDQTTSPDTTTEVR